MFDGFSDGFTDIGRNCGCGGVFVLVDQYHGKCGMCGQTKLTQAGHNKRDERERTILLAKMQKERDRYNALHPEEGPEGYDYTEILAEMAEEERQAKEMESEGGGIVTNDH
jgi:coenzyme F420-reducing hydrogenase beta subunit